MRKILRAIFAALGRVVVRTVRLASGVMMTFVELLRPATPPVEYDDPAVDDAVARVDDAAGRDDEIEGLRHAGSVIQRAAEQMLTHNAVIDQSVPVGVRNWIRTLPRRDLAAIVAADPVLVARHMLGLATLSDDFGIPLSRPDERRDMERLERREEDKKRREAAYASPTRKRSANSSLVPSMNLGF